MSLASDAQPDVVSKYTFLKQRIKPTGPTVEERELEAALLELLHATGCPQSSIRGPDAADSSLSTAMVVRTCQERVCQQLQVCVCVCVCVCVFSAVLACLLVSP